MEKKPKPRYRIIEQANGRGESRYYVKKRWLCFWFCLRDGYGECIRYFSTKEAAEKYIAECETWHAEASWFSTQTWEIH
jgi:hypothetical protein